MKRFNIGDIDDCQVFDGLFEFSQVSTGGSVSSAMNPTKQQKDLTVNWSGGLHHAKKFETSGSCYISDIVLATLELLKHHQSVLYVDTDIHRDDCREEDVYLHLPFFLLPLVFDYICLLKGSQIV